jgi:hypothetical protein
MYLHDKNFTLTFRLKLQNILEKPQLLEKLKIGTTTMSRMTGAIEEILKVVPIVEKNGIVLGGTKMWKHRTSLEKKSQQH